MDHSKRQPKRGNVGVVVAIIGGVAIFATLLILQSQFWKLISTHDTTTTTLDEQFSERLDPEPTSQISPLPDEVIVIEVSGKDIPRIGLQTRFFKGMTRGGITKAAAEKSLRAIYEHLKAEIEATQPSAKDKRIHILLGTCEAEISEGLPFAIADTGSLAATLPEWPPESVQISPRDEATRPNRHQELMYLAQMRTIRDARKLVEDAYLDSSGILRIPSDRSLQVEKEVERQQEHDLDALAADLDVPRDEIDRNWFRWSLWTGGIAATDEAIEQAYQASK